MPGCIRSETEVSFIHLPEYKNMMKMKSYYSTSGFNQKFEMFFSKIGALIFEILCSYSYAQFASAPLQ